MKTMTREQAIDETYGQFHNAASVVAEIDTLPLIPGVYETKYVVNTYVYFADSDVYATKMQFRWNENEVDGDCLDRLLDLSVQRDRDEVAA
jgi:hypothetical protein